MKNILKRCYKHMSTEARPFNHVSYHAGRKSKDRLVFIQISFRTRWYLILYTRKHAQEKTRHSENRAGRYGARVRF